MANDVVSFIRRLHESVFTAHETIRISGFDRQRKTRLPAIGFVTKQKDGSYKGELTTLTIQTPLEIRPVLQKEDDRHPDFRVYAADNVEIGTGRKRIGKGSSEEYIALSLAVPEFGPRRLRANLGRAAGSDDKNVFAIIWNPDD